MIDQQLRDDLHRQLRAAATRSATNAAILYTLSRRPDGATMRELIAAIGEPASTLRPALDELVRAGALERTGNPAQWHLTG